MTGPGGKPVVPPGGLGTAVKRRVRSRKVVAPMELPVLRRAVRAGNSRRICLFVRHLTIDSELARTRGIRLSN